MVQKYKKISSGSSYGIGFSCTLQLAMLLRNTLKIHTVSYSARSSLLHCILKCVCIIKCKKIIKYFKKWQNIPGNDLLFSGTKCPTLSYETQTDDTNPVGVSAKLLTISIFLFTCYIKILRPSVRLDHDVLCHTPMHTAVSVLNSHAVTSTKKRNVKSTKEQAFWKM